MTAPNAVICALEDTIVASHALRASTWLARELGVPVLVGV